VQELPDQTSGPGIIALDKPHIYTGAEGLLAIGVQHHHPDVTVLFDVPNGINDLFQDIAVQGVEDLGPVQRDGGDFSLFR